MKRLNENEIEKFAKYLGFTVQNAKYITNIFYEEKLQGNRIIKHAKLETIEDYVEEWENCWYRYMNWEGLIKSEIEQGSDGLTEEQCKEELGSSIFELPTGMYIQSVY